VVPHFVVDEVLWMAMSSYFLPRRYFPADGPMPMRLCERESVFLSDNSVISVVLS
jgi:hypothetical protein